MFWTVALPDSAVKVNLDEGKAEMHVRNLLTEDYFNFPNASADGPEADATVSFDVVWRNPVTRRVSVSDAANGFSGTFLEDQATINWSATNELGFSFVANAGSFATTVPGAGPVGQMGREPNGRFCRTGGQDDAGRNQLFALLGAKELGDNGLSESNQTSTVNDAAIPHRPPRHNDEVTSAVARSSQAKDEAAALKAHAHAVSLDWDPAMTIPLTTLEA